VTGLGRGPLQGQRRGRGPSRGGRAGRRLPADIAVLREQPHLAGPASDPVVFPLFRQLHRDLPQALKRVRGARAAGRERVWALAGGRSPGCGRRPGPNRRPARHRRCRPLLAAFPDHGSAGNSEPLAILLWHGSDGSSTAADHVEVTRLGLAQLPKHLRWRVLVHTGSGGGTHGVLQWLTASSRPPPAPGSAAVVHRPRRPPLHRDRHRGETRPARRPGAAAPSPRPLPGTDPQRQGHGAAEPAAQRLRRQPSVVQGRRPGVRASGLDSAARPHRRRPPLGTETAPAPPLGGRGAAVGCGSDWGPPALGWVSPPPSSACKACRPADQPDPARRPGKHNTKGRGIPPTRAAAGQHAAAGH
jgi:hypothetical protein